ncbi:hypothetical protein ASG43_20550 [Aureimonas sp. Leaf454]|uniref:FtsX-like permease family protein n=1 Tax=Aureimonas sp. Leaf454 TaxID=1736381 RepID=UPI0006FF30F7|nr:ABC transporter permease [Aureimonas sp. Leaf454]KQT52081.1 hypothetical protein ASG43_20550 [Aureimonas sp. Leaf454]
MRAAASVFSARLALAWLVGGEVRAHPARLLGVIVAIAVGVALGFAVHLVNGSALSAFDGAVRGVNGTADLQVQAASPLGFDEAIYPAVARSEGVIDASPVVRLDAESRGGRFALLGLDIIRAAAVTPSLVGLRPTGPDATGERVFSGDALFLSAAALQATNARVGDTIEVAARGRTARLTVAGLLPGVAEGQAIGTIDIAAAQWRFDRLGRLDRIDLTLSDRSRAEAALRRILPADAALGSTATEAMRGNALSRAYRVNLDMLALVALLTGGFLVYSAQSLSVARRLRAFALVRTLGLPRSGIVALVALEGLVIGLIGSGLGLGLGYALAGTAIAFLGGDLGAGYFRGGGVAVVFQPVSAAVFFALGLAAALAGSILPARAASKAAPAAALKNAGDLIDPRRAAPWKRAAALLLVGSAITLLPPVGNLPVFGFAGMALMLAGGVAGVPFLARRLLSPLSRQTRLGVPGALALRHVHGAPNEAATALCGIVASTALMIAMATMVTSFRGAVDDWLGDVLASDLYLRTEDGGGFTPERQARLLAVPGVAAIDFSRQLPLGLAPDRPPVTLIARSIDPAKAGEALVLLDEAPPVGDVSGDALPVWVSEPAARLYGWSAGETITLPIGPGAAPFRIAGIWRDYARQAGALVVRANDYQSLTGDAARGEAAVTLASGADPGRTGEALLSALRPDLEPSLAEPATLRRYALDLFDRSFLVTYVLEAIAVLVGLAGVAATMSSQTLARVREFGMLRHLGLGKAQIRAMLGIEGALLGAVGGLAGVALGLALAQVLIHVINPQSFNWTMSTRLPLGTMAGVVAALVLAAAGTAMVAGRRATGMDAVTAVREDW